MSQRSLPLVMVLSSLSWIVPPSIGFGMRFVGHRDRGRLIGAFNGTSIVLVRQWALAMPPA